MQPHFSKGARNSIAFVFSCPGRQEKINGHPAAGITGRNLERLLALVGRRLEYGELTRVDVTIANAWAEIEYKNLTGRSEATDAEIRRPDNIRRLAAEIEHVTELIVFCGDKAKIASQELRKDHIRLERPDFAWIGHLGTLGLNQIATDGNGNSIVNAKTQRGRGRSASLRQIESENSGLRLDVVVERLVASIALHRA